MDRILTTRSTSISTFKTNPQAALREAGDEPFAVLTNNKPSFYVLTPELFEQKTAAVFQHVYDAYYGAGRSIYAAA